MTLNIASYSGDWRSRLLSTFAHTPFELRCGSAVLRCESVEGFWQGLKFPEGSADRERVFGLWGLEAKRAGAAALPSATIEFCGRSLYRGSADHHALAELAMRAKLGQNAEVRDALLATRGLGLTHDLVDEKGDPLSDSLTLPAAVFCALWTRIREELIGATG